MNQSDPGDSPHGSQLVRWLVAASCVVVAGSLATWIALAPSDATDQGASTPTTARGSLKTATHRPAEDPVTKFTFDEGGFLKTAQRTAQAALNAPAGPGTEPGHELIDALRSKKITVDGFVRDAVAAVTDPSSLPSDLRPSQPLGDSAGMLLWLAGTHVKAATFQTQSWFRELSPSIDTGGDALAAPTSIDAQRGTRTSASSDRRCGQDNRVLTFTYRCEVHTAHVTVLYNHDDVLPASTDPTGAPTAVDATARSAENAHEALTRLGYPVATSCGCVEILIGGPSGVTTPFTTMLAGGGAVLTVLPTDPVDYDAIPRQEAVRAFQYAEIAAHPATSDFITGLVDAGDTAPIAWWMEATAAWGARQTFVTYPAVGYPYDPNWPTKYEGGYAAAERRLPTRGVGAALTHPDRAVDRWDPAAPSAVLGDIRLPDYLTEQTGDPAAVLQTWRSIGQDRILPMDGVGAVLGRHGIDVKTALLDFAAADYKLTGAGENDGYDDADAATLWRQQLGDPANHTAADDWAPARPAHDTVKTTVGAAKSSDYSIEPGGARYVDLVMPPSDGHPLSVTVSLDAGPNVAFGLMPWNGTGKSARPNRIVPAVNGVATTLMDPTQPMVTVVITRTDYSADPARLGAAATVRFETMLKASAAPRIMVVGDSIADGADGDFTWRYRLYRHFADNGVDVAFVGPHVGTLNMYDDPGFTDEAGKAPAGDPDNPLDGGYRNGPFNSNSDAVWGWSAALAKGEIATDVRGSHPDVLLIQLGNNDLGFGPDAALQNLHSVVDAARTANPDLKFLIATVLHRDEPPNYPNPTNPVVSEFDGKLTAAVKAWSTTRSPSPSPTSTRDSTRQPIPRTRSAPPPTASTSSRTRSRPDSPRSTVSARCRTRSRPLSPTRSRPRPRFSARCRPQPASSSPGIRCTGPRPTRS